jgi:predicted MFS family arabinose efflux permease
MHRRIAGRLWGVMEFYVIVVLTVLNHIAYKGSKMLISLYAIELGAAPSTIGILYSLYSFFSLFLALYAGRVSDRFGPRVPMLIGSLALCIGLLLPYLWRGFPALFMSALLIGTLYIFYTVSAQHLIGAFGAGHKRTRNYATFSLGVALTALLGPTMTGFLIDSIQHQATYLVLALLPAGPVIFLLFFARRLPRVAEDAKRDSHRTIDLLRNPPLRRAFIAAGIIETGGELFSFYMPIYGHSINLSASLIGIILGTYAVAILMTRLVMSALVRRSSEEAVLWRSMALAAVACMLFPFVTSVYMLMTISFVLGLGLGCCGPLSMVITYNRAPDGRSGEAMGLRQSFNKLTEVLVPLIFGTVGSAFGIGAAFWMDAALLGVGAAIMKSDAGRRAQAAALQIR